MALRVTKRNGNVEDVQFDKITKRLNGVLRTFNKLDPHKQKLLTESRIQDGPLFGEIPVLILNISPVIIAQKTINSIVDLIKTSEIDDVAARESQQMVLIHPDYGVFAGMILTSNLMKETPEKFSKCVRLLHSENIVSDTLSQVVEAHQEVIDGYISDNDNYGFDMFAFATLQRSYLLRNRAQKIMERPSYMYMRIALSLHEHDIERALETYRALVDQYISHASPTMFNAGTVVPQLASCFLIDVAEDSIEGIFNTVKECALISKYSGGIGLAFSKVRGKGARIAGTNGRTDGSIPALQVFNKTLQYVDQGGNKRKGSVAVYLEPWHTDILEFLELRLPTGHESARCREMFTCLYINNLFMKRVENDEMYSLFDEHSTNGLCTTFGEVFENLYLQYEREGRYTKQVKARDIWNAALTSQMLSGAPYVTNKDSINTCTNFNEIIKSSNLCAEIALPTNPDEIAVCNLASLSLKAFIRDDLSYDYEGLGNHMRMLVRNLNLAIDRMFYPHPKCKVSNMKYRPLGIGVNGLHSAFQKMKMPFDSEAAKDFNKKVLGTMYYYGLFESCDLAKKTSPYPEFNNTKFSKGILQFDMWGVTPDDRYDWDELKRDIMQHGTANSQITALMPTASSASILGSSESFDPITSNCYQRKVLSGEFILMNKYLIADLEKINNWDHRMQQELLKNDGSIQNIPDLSVEMKNLYKTAFEISQKHVIDLSADRGPYVDQTQSLNLFMAEPTHAKLSSMLFYGWKKQLKSLAYYVRRKTVVSGSKFAVERSGQSGSKQDVSNHDPAAAVCRRDDPNCLACSA